LDEGTGILASHRRILKLARTASDPDVQSRFVAIARHYRMLADAEERSAEHKGAERRSPNEVQQ